MAFSVGKSLGPGWGYYAVRFRIDKNEPQKGIWLASSTGTILLVVGTGAVSLARDMLAGREILLEVTDYRGVVRRARYSLAGSPAAIGKVMDECAIEK
jgi:hypothetical protein